MTPKALTLDRLPAERVAIGAPDDYKPCVALLPDGELLMTAFHQHPLGDRKVREEILLFRSRDGGRNWSGPEQPDLLGREPYLTALGDGTLFMTVHLLANDVRNPDGYTHSYLHRSTDSGKSWTTLRIGPEGFPPQGQTMTSRNVLEADGTLLLGVDSAQGPAYLWRSADRGKSWDRGQPCDNDGFQSAYSYFGEAVLWRARSGKLWSIVRVDSNEHPMMDRPTPEGQGDQRDHMVLYASSDNGGALRKVADFGDYGEMYPAILRLQDGRLLLTFTVRELRPPLGVHALLGSETDDGFAFDFGQDRLVLDAKTPHDQPSGGGFGPTVQLPDGTLVTAYSFRAADGKSYLEAARWRLP